MLKLPNETLHSIASLSSISALASLSRCSSHFHKPFSPLLYKQDLAGQILALERSVSRYRDPDDVLNVFESILKAGGFSVDDCHRINAVHIAAYAGLTRVVEFIIKGCYVTLGPFSTGPLRYVLHGRHIETSKTLIQHGVDLRDENLSALEVAAGQGLAEIVGLLVDEKGMDPDGLHGVSSPLFCAVQYCKAGSGDDALATVTFLLDRGANPDQPGYVRELVRNNISKSPLAQACRLKEFEIGLRLLRHGAHPGNRVISDREVALNRLKRCLLPDKSGLIKFTTELVDHLTNTTMPERSSTLWSEHPLGELLQCFAPSLENLFVSHALLRAGLRIPWTLGKKLGHMASLSDWTTRNVEVAMIYYPFMDLDYIIHRNIDRVVWAVENERKGAHLFGRVTSPVLVAELGAGFQYDWREIFKQWRALTDMEFDKYVANM